MTRSRNKGIHEKSMEQAKDLLDKGIGMTEIKNRTQLSEEDVMKAKDKMQGKR
ncbi:hypothetical protein HBE96_00610 [Clostridium sp. P21]|uniref:Uncharacterized protein n=1 Tax=Clostridium muellerianum TaxID=2716538 RepID=A0A7Y0EEW8_9CLOT|nr:hypothetical protein [Clostridium muellerianum]NMM61225.1 hypothetical protein [Clostridium muellerianum]